MASGELAKTARHLRGLQEPAGRQQCEACCRRGSSLDLPPNRTPPTRLIRLLLPLLCVVVTTHASPYLRSPRDPPRRRAIRGGVDYPLGLSLSVCPETLRRIAAPWQHQVGGGDAQERQRLAIETLPIFGEPSATVERGDGALNSSTARKHRDFKFSQIGMEGDLRQDLHLNLAGASANRLYNNDLDQAVRQAAPWRSLISAASPPAALLRWCDQSHMATNCGHGGHGSPPRASSPPPTPPPPQPVPSRNT